MEYLIAVLFLSFISFMIYKYSNKECLDLHEEKAEVQASLENTLEDLEELDQKVQGTEKSEKGKSLKSLRLLKRRIASKKVAIQSTLDKVDLEGEINWDYRKLQAERTIESAKELTADSDSSIMASS